MQAARLMPQSRAGARMSRSGASARVDTSNRTWSLPFPVQPWATASAPCSRAAAKRCFVMTGLDRAGGERALDNRLVVDGAAVLADVDREGDHLDAHVVDHPPHCDGGVETA